MKRKMLLLLTIICFLYSLTFAGNHKLKHKNLKENYRQKLDQRIENAIETGLITKEEGDKLLSQKKELEEYKNSIWQDDVMTKEEKEKLDTMHKNFKENMKIILDSAMKKWDEKKRDTKFHRELVQTASKNGKITENESRNLLKQIDDFETLEKEIWADDKMTKHEFEKLQQAKQDLRQNMRKLFFDNEPRKGLRPKIKPEKCSCPDCPKFKKHNLEQIEGE